MSKRPEAPSEKKLHKRIVEADTVRGGLKGVTVGTAVGSALRHLGHAGKHAPLTGAALGAAAGSISGYHHGKERELRDAVQQERLHQRAEARVKKAYDEAMWTGFRAELEKQANPLAAAAGGILGGVGRGLIGMAAQGARGSVGRSIGAGALNVARGAGFTGANAYKAVGGAALGAGALGAAALGRASAPSQPRY